MKRFLLVFWYIKTFFTYIFEEITQNFYLDCVVTNSHRLFLLQIEQ